MFDKSIIDWYHAVDRRVTLQAIGTLIRRDGDIFTVVRKPFKEREAEAYNEVVEKLGKLRLDDGVIEEITEIYAPYTGLIEDINFNLGMKAGAKLQLQLLSDFEKDY